MRVTRHNRPIGSLLAVALVLGAGFLPAAAQSGSEAVVCVGSETRTHQANPIRRVFTEDMEIVYRIGVDIGERNQMESNLSSELGSYPEVWCAWSDPGDDHAVIISYTGVIRQDLTVDPEDPRFQAFSVGFGEDFDEAETRATTINQRFSSQNDGSGYEVLLRETWSVARSQPNFSEEEMYKGVASSVGALDGDVQPPRVLPVERGPPRRCDGGLDWGVFKRLRPGERTGSWFQNGELIVATEGTHVDGESHGPWTIFWEEGDVAREVGPYVNGERHGIWTGYDASGNVVGTARFENGRRVGDLDGSVALDQSSDSRSLARRGHEAASAPHDGGPP